MKQALKTYLESLAVGPVQSHLNLSVFPLLSDQVDTLDFLTLDEALDGKLVTVTEVSEGGSVPELRVLNASGTMVLIPDGEELVGAKQNRIVNTTILIGAGANIAIPVSCVEQGRWTYDTPEFRSEGRVMSSKLRASKADQVQFSLKASGRFASDQGAIWEDISDLAQTRAAVSPSMAMSAIYKKERARLENYSSKFSPLDGQVGPVFVSAVRHREKHHPVARSAFGLGQSSPVLQDARGTRPGPGPAGRDARPGPGLCRGTVSQGSGPVGGI